MKVHIVTQELRGDSILARLAGTLAEGTGFSMSPDPRDDVDLNYYFPYLFWNENTAKKETLTAGWFTHRDDLFSESKGNMWGIAAQAVNCRLSSAAMYQRDLLAYGRSEYVTPPIDLDKFKPGELRGRHPRPIIGVAGFVYPGGRKGEHLVKQLMQNRPTWEVRGAGRGWPCPTHKYPWEVLEQFYQGLDVLLCTSLVEGIGYPPMEALACGVPVVVPQQVGIFDELPDMPGVYRYKPGDYESMAAALQIAVDTPHRQDHLRGAVARFTPKAWVSDHLRIFESMTDSSLVAYPPSPDWQGRAGVMYYAFGEPARKCAIDAINSWRRHMGDIPAALVSSEPLGVEDRFIPYTDHDIGARWAKTKIYDIAPQEWEYVLYLDADTEIVADVRFLFKVLADGWELVICKNPDKYHTTRRMTRPDNVDECTLTFERMGTDDAIQWNGGVFAFRRNPRTEAFFATWHEEWQVYGKRDQAALLRAMWRVPLRVYTLGNEWNTITRYIDPGKTAGILHYPMTARRHIGVVQGRLDSPEAWSKVKKI